MNSAKAKLKKLDQLSARQHSFRLVGSQHARLSEATQVFSYLVILRRDAIARINHKNDYISLCHCLAGLFGHFLEYATSCIRFESARVNGNEFVFALFAITIMTISSQTSVISHDSITRLS